MNAMALNLWTGLGQPERTGSVLGDRVVFENFEHEREEHVQHTAFVHSSGDNYLLREVLPAWDEALPQTVLDPTLECARSVALFASAPTGGILHVRGDRLIGRRAIWLSPGGTEPYTIDAYDAVRFVEQSLGVPVRDVLKSAGIARRTFYSWGKSQVRRPRLASEGRLWSLVQVTEDLVSILGRDLVNWMKADSRRRDWLTKGQHDVLLASLMVERSRADEALQRSVVGPSSAVGPEPELPRMSPRRIPNRGASARRISSRYDRAVEVPSETDES
jgi:hypothetical protein